MLSAVHLLHISASRRRKHCPLVSAASASRNLSTSWCATHSLIIMSLCFVIQYTNDVHACRCDIEIWCPESHKQACFICFVVRPSHSVIILYCGLLEMIHHVSVPWPYWPFAVAHDSFTVRLWWTSHDRISTNQQSSSWLVLWRLRITSFHWRWHTHTMQCLVPTVLYTDVDGQCDILWRMTVTSLTTLSVHLSWQHLKRSAVPEMWLVPTKILMVYTWPKHAPFRDSWPSVG